jgi:cytidylate kinase
MKNGLIIAIDGPVGAGKSTVARMLADRFDFLYLDSGAMYRAVAWKTLDRGVSADNPEAMGRLCRDTRMEMSWEGRGMRISVDGVEVTEKIRTPEISRMASRVSLIPGVRDCLGKLQRRSGGARPIPGAGS